MDWSPLVSTALGALIGVGATLVADRSKWRRDRRDRDLALKRQVYGDYLAALSRTWNEIRAAALSSAMPAEERSRVALEAFKERGAYELRHQVEITAPQPVVDLSVTAFRALRDLRDVVQAGALHEDAGYRAQRGLWDASFEELRLAIRRDLRTP